LVVGRPNNPIWEIGKPPLLDQMQKTEGGEAVMTSCTKKYE
jgi:hypothetical protein